VCAEVGAAGFVLNADRELLVVKEWRDNGRGKLEPGVQWKLPGGLLDRGESFSDGVTREVLEETGVRTAFRSVLAFWHRHGLTWGQSDLYFVARLDSLESSRELRPQPSEISAVRWMPLDEFVRTQDHPLILPIVRKLYGVERGADGGATGGAEGNDPIAELLEEPVQFPGRPPYPTYFPTARGR
jgi:8-oxo-dGTP pyrophosphatase MutT (NUDIX family)